MKTPICIYKYIPICMLRLLKKCQKKLLCIIQKPIYLSQPKYLADQITFLNDPCIRRLTQKSAMFFAFDQTVFPLTSGKGEIVFTSFDFLVLRITDLYSISFVCY